MLKRVTAIMLAVILSTAGITEHRVSGAYIPPDSLPQYQFFFSCNSKLTLSDNDATCKSTVVGISGTTTKIVIYQVLQKKISSSNWDDVCSWDHTYYSFEASFTNYRYDLSSGTYRLKSQFTVYSGSSYETETKYSSEVTV